MSLRVALAVACLLACVLPAQARIVYRCVRDGTVSLATAPEPGSKCEAKEIPDDAVQTPNLWGNFGVFSGVLYQREQDGKKVYSTRNLPGSVPVNASSLYARNLQAFVEPMIDKTTKTLAINFDDELVKGTLIAKDGTIVNAMIAERLGGGGKPSSAASGEGDGKKAAPKRQSKGAKS